MPDRRNAMKDLESRVSFLESQDGQLRFVSFFAMLGLGVAAYLAVHTFKVHDTRLKAVEAKTVAAP
jgi:hypothetical protein